MPDESGLFTAKGRLLLEIIETPGTTIAELAKSCFLTKRSIWGYIDMLRRMKYIVVRTVKRDRRTHHYYVSSLGLTELRRLTEQADKGTGW